MRCLLHVLASVNLNSNFFSWTVEVENVAADTKLPSKFESPKLPTSEP